MTRISACVLLPILLFLIIGMLVDYKYIYTKKSLYKKPVMSKADEKKKAESADFSNRPCIAEDLMPDWLANVAHNSRQAMDSLVKNQCRNYHE